MKIVSGFDLLFYNKYFTNSFEYSVNEESHLKFKFI